MPAVSGQHFYCSHCGLQRGDGIVRLYSPTGSTNSMKTLQTKRKKTQHRSYIFYKMAVVFVLACNIAIALPVLSGSNVILDSTVMAAPDPPAKDKDAPQKVVQPIGVAPVPKECPKGQCIINKYINPAINLVSGLVGVGVTVSIVYAGIQYASSADNPQKVSAARQRITTSIFVLVGYFVFYAFLNWVIPGGTGAI